LEAMNVLDGTQVVQHGAPRRCRSEVDYGDLGRFGM